MGLHFNFALGPHIMYQSYISTPSNLRIQDQGPSVLPSPVFSEGGKEHLLNLIQFRWRSRDLFLNWTSHNILYPRTTFHRPSSTPQKWLCLHLAFHGYQSHSVLAVSFSLPPLNVAGHPNLDCLQVSPLTSPPKRLLCVNNAVGPFPENKPKLCVQQSTWPQHISLCDKKRCWGPVPFFLVITQLISFTSKTRSLNHQSDLVVLRLNSGTQGIALNQYILHKTTSRKKYYFPVIYNNPNSNNSKSPYSIYPPILLIVCNIAATFILIFTTLTVMYYFSILQEIKLKLEVGT